MSDWSDHESGPFCRHWGDPVDCEEVCANCGHGCTRHAASDGNAECFEPDCDCPAWEEQ